MLNHEFPPVGGGASPVTFELCRQLARMGHEVDVVTMHYGKLPRFERVEGFGVYRTPAIRKQPNICHPHELATYLPGAFFKTLSLAKKNKYDIIHCHFIVPGSPLAWLISKLTGIPFIITCHGSDVPGHNPDRFKLLHKIIKPAWRFFVRSAALVTAPSEFLKKRVLSNCSGLEVTVVPNGIYVENYTPTTKTKSILLCSRIFKFKGFQYAIEAIKDMRLDWEVNIIGEGPYLPELRKLAEGSQTPIKFWGWLDKGDPRFSELFGKSSIFVFPSEMENFPTVLLEAMAAGMAVITSTAGGCPEVVGEAGLLVEPRNAGAIRQKLEELITSEPRRVELMTAARKRAAMFGWHTIASRYVECYQKVINKRKGR
jgi:glycosyltransferase involved in cell wall biosynthesis